MPYFGDIYIPWITDKDTSITRDVVEKNFVDEKPQVYELNPDLEGGTYSLILNETYSDKNESFLSQQDAVLSMVSRHGTEFPFSLGNDEAYLLVESADTGIDPRQEIREASIQARILPQYKFSSALEISPSVIDNEFSYDDGIYTYVGFPSTVNTPQSRDFKIPSEDGDIDIFLVSSNSSLFEISDSSGGYGSSYGDNYGLTEGDLANAEQKSICKLFNSNGERIYSDSLPVKSGSQIDNSLIRADLNTNSSNIDFWNGTTWETFGNIEIGFEAGYARENYNREIELKYVNGNTTSIYHSFPAIKYGVSNVNNFVLNPDSWGTIDFIESTDYYAAFTDTGDSNSEDVIIVRTKNDGSFYSSTSEFGIQNLDPLQEHTIFVGVIPEELTPEEFAQTLYTRGSRRRTFTQK